MSGLRVAGEALPRLTGLRAVAALAVFGYHLGRWEVLPFNPVPIGYVGVSFFFLLSGFVIAWVTPVGVSPKRFYHRRFARIYPLHFTCLALALIVPHVPFEKTGWAAAANVLLVQSWFPSDEIAFGLNGVSWSLSCEAFLYLCLPVLLHLLKGQGQRSRWIWAWSLLALTGLFQAVLHVVGASPLWAYTFPPMRLAEFLLGVVAAAAVRDGLHLPARMLPFALGLAVPLVLLAPFPGAGLARPAPGTCTAPPGHRRTAPASRTRCAMPGRAGAGRRWRAAGTPPRLAGCR